jgi:O-antigen/teichoic acid export membrane protein
MNLFSRGISNSFTDEFFQTKHLERDLKERTVRGGAVTIANQALKFILRMGSTVLLARLLTPKDYGLLGMVTIITGFIEIFNDLGLSAATVQRPYINHKQVSTLFWINVAMGTILCLLVAALSPAIAKFYNQPELIGITLLLAGNFLISSFGSQHNALLRRQMRFYSIARVDIIATCISLLAAIALASYGAGYWALVWMQVIASITNTLGLWITSGWQPGLPTRNSEIRSMLTFGWNLTGFRCFNYFSRSFDNFLIGSNLGPQSLGIYAKAYQLLLLPVQQINTPINSVAISALSSLQSKPDEYSTFYRKAILTITTLGMPIVALMFASADKIILILLGEKWLEVVPLFQLLAPAAFIGTFNVATGWVYQTLGRTDRQFRSGIALSIINMVVFLIGIQWGVTGVAAAYGISQPILIVPTIIYCYYGTPLKFTDFLSSIYKPAIASIGAGILLTKLNLLIRWNVNPLSSLIIDCVLYGLLYIGIWLLLPNGKNTLLNIFQLTKSFKKKPK